MKKLYLLLDNELKLCITVDRCIILYKEYEYTESILDQLYSKIAAHNVDEAIVITKGILSEQFFNESYKVFSFSIRDSEHNCYVSKFDVNKVVNLLNTAGVNNVRVLDKFGYYVSLNKQDCCMIDTLGNAYSVITFKDKIRDISYNSYQNLEKILINCNKKFAVSDFIDMTTYYDERYLKYFKNANKIQEDLEKSVRDNNESRAKSLIMVLAALSTFAYSELKIAHYFELNQDRITLINANPIHSEDDYENDYEEDLMNEIEEESEDTEAAEALAKNSEEDKESNSKEIFENANQTPKKKKQPKKPKEEKKKKKKEKREKKVANKVTTAVNVIGIALAIGMLGSTAYSTQSVTKYTQQIGALSSQNEEILDQIDTSNAVLSDYQGFTNNLNTSATYAKMYSTLAKTPYGKDVKNVSYEDGVMKAELYVKKKQEKKKSNPKDLITKQLKKDLGKSFEVQQLTEEKSDKGGYLLYSINLANK